MKLIYIYHSGFALVGENFTVIIDYYKDSASQLLTGVVHDELLERPGKLYVLSSHSHADHFNPEVLEWKVMHPDVQYVFSTDILENGLARLNDACYLSKGETWSDGVLEVEAFGSTDLGISFLLRLDGKLIFHAGDLNNWHWKEESTEEEVCEAVNTCLADWEILARRTDRMDLVMFPVDPRLGLEYMLGAKQFVDRFRVGMFVPMHFDEEYVRANAFREYAESRGVRFVELTYRGEEVKI